MAQSTEAKRLGQAESAVEQLNETEYSEFRRWFLDRDWELWDKQLAANAAAGKLDFLMREAQQAKDSRELRDL
jgi:hypothetical protein